MNRAKFSLRLEDEEAIALIESAKAECREPNEQARYLLREAMRLKGLLPAGQSNSRLEGWRLSSEYARTA